MKRLLVAGALVAGLVGSGCARETQVATAGPGAMSAQVVSPVKGRVPAGTTLWVSLDQKLSARTNNVGDPFTGRVMQDVRSPGGQLLIPAGATVIGRIGGLQPSPSAGKPAVIALDIEAIEIAGTRQPLNASIVQTEVPRQRPRIRGRDVAIGAIGGAVLGGIIEGGSGALVGGALGAGAGTLVSLGTGDVPPELPRGTQMAVQLNKPVRSYALIQQQRRVE